MCLVPGSRIPDIHLARRAGGVAAARRHAAAYRRANRPPGVDQKLDGAFVPLYRQPSAAIEQAVRALTGERRPGAGVAAAATTSIWRWPAPSWVRAGSSAPTSARSILARWAGRRLIAGHARRLVSPAERQAVRVRRGRRQRLERDLPPRRPAGGLSGGGGVRALRAAAQRVRLRADRPGGRSEPVQPADRRRFAHQVELTFSQRFRKLPDGATFDQIFTGTEKRQVAVDDSTSIEQTERVAGTLSLGLRRYAEGEGYLPTPLPEQPSTIRGGRRRTPNTGEEVAVAGKWNLHPGGRPSSGRSRRVAERVRQDPALADIDFYGAIKRGDRELEPGLRLSGAAGPAGRARRAARRRRRQLLHLRLRPDASPGRSPTRA